MTRSWIVTDGIAAKHDEHIWEILRKVKRSTALVLIWWGNTLDTKMYLRRNIDTKGSIKYIRVKFAYFLAGGREITH